MEKLIRSVDCWSVPNSWHSDSSNCHLLSLETDDCAHWLSNFSSKQGIDFPGGQNVLMCSQLKSCHNMCFWEHHCINTKGERKKNSRITVKLSKMSLLFNSKMSSFEQRKRSYLCCNWFYSAFYALKNKK